MTGSMNDTVMTLRAAALAVLRLRGKSSVDDGGVTTVGYADDVLRLCLQPRINGSSMPSYLDIWHVAAGKMPVLTVTWLDAGTGLAPWFKVHVFRPGSSWQAALVELAEAPARLQAAREARHGVGAGQGAKVYQIRNNALNVDNVAAQ